jgi:hypothetical protein
MNETRYQQIKDLHQSVATLLSKYLPNTQIIPTLGNNDWLYHYQSPYTDFKADFYGLLFDKWFQQQGVSRARSDIDKIKSTFLDGGYYRIDMSDNLSVLGLNTLLWNH